MINISLKRLNVVSRDFRSFIFKSIGLFGLIVLSSQVLFAQGFTSHQTTNLSFREQGLQIGIIAGFELRWGAESFMGSKNYALSITSVTGGVQTIAGIEYRGKLYQDTDFDGALKPYFSAITLTGFSYSARIDGLTETNCMTYNATNVFTGHVNSQFCKPAGTDIQIRDVQISRVRLTGVWELQRKIMQLEDEARAAAIAAEAAKAAEVAEQARLEAELAAAGAANTAAGVSTGTGSANESSSQQTSVEDRSTTQVSPLQVLRAQAGALEAEGDYLNSMGSMYAMQAYQKYKEAQNVFYTERVQIKINAIEGEVQLAMGLNSLGRGIERELDKITQDLDPEYTTSWSALGLHYLGKPSEFGSVSPTSPQGTYLSMAMHYLYISLDMRLGYYILPDQNYSIYRHGWNRNIAETATIRSTAVGFGASAGVNLPLKQFNIFFLHGIDALLEDSFDVIANNFVYDSKSSPGNHSPMFRHTTFGINYNIPDTQLILGINYNIYTLPGKDYTDYISNRLRYVGSNSDFMISSSNRNSYYRLDKSLSSKYVFKDIGFNMMYRFRRNNY